MFCRNVRLVSPQYDVVNTMSCRGALCPVPGPAAMARLPKPDRGAAGRKIPLQAPAARPEAPSDPSDGRDGAGFHRARMGGMAGERPIIRECGGRLTGVACPLRHRDRARDQHEIIVGRPPITAHDELIM
jgi:hypothetical protein